MRWEVIGPILLIMFLGFWFLFYKAEASLPWLWALGATVVFTLLAFLALIILLSQDSL